MKRIYMTLVGMLALAASSQAYDFQTNGIYYNITSETEATVEVAKGDFTYSGKIVVPSEVEHEGKTFEVTGCGYQAFRYNTSLDTVVLPPTIEYIADECFLGCRLREIQLPASLEKIGNNVFTHSYIKDLVIPASVTSIANGAFYLADSLKSITVAESNTTYSDMEGILFNKEGTSLLCFPPNKKIQSYTVPLNTLALEDYAFASQSYLERIHLPASLASIGKNVFENILTLQEITVDKDNLTYVSSDGVLFNSDLTQIICFPMGKTSSGYILPDGLKKIGNMALAYAQFESLTIPNSVEEIGDSALIGCSRLKSIEIPSSVTKIGSYAFALCRALKTVTLPKGLTEIAPGLFYVCDSMQSLTIPETVTQIGASAFWSCTALTKLEIPSSVESIGSNAIANCGNLEELELPDNLRTIGNAAFAYNYKLKSITIPDKIDSLPIAIFYDDHVLEQVTLPDNLKYIGNMAFASCGSLTELSIPNSVSQMGCNVFEFSGLQDIKLSTSLQEIPENTFTYCYELQSITIPDNIRYIGQEAFASCSDLRNVTFSQNLDSIGESAFNGCSVLTDITLPKKLKKIADQAFYGCSALKEIIVPDSVTYIGANSFYDCTNLVSIQMPALLEELGTYAFGWCSKLTSIVLPSSVKRLGASSFENCSNLQSLNIPDSIETIEDYLASFCKNLQSLSIGKSVQEIGYWAFSGCDSIEDIRVYTTTPPNLEEEAFSCYGAATLHVPAGTREEYVNHPVWGLFTVKEMEECDIPYDLILNGSPGYHNLNISWTGKSPSYQIQWKRKTSDTIEQASTSQTMYTLNSLDLNTEYAIRIRSICKENDTSAWCEWTIFSTDALPECPTPINLTAEAITESSARLVWEASKENEAFSLRFKPASEPTWDSIEEILEQEYVLSNLEGNTAYVWAVKSFCSENRQSEWSADEQFKTEKLSNKSTKRSFLQVSAFQKQIHILNPSALHIDRINIYALNGTLLAHHEIDSHENVTLTANFDTRIIILSVENGETALRYKVFLP